MWHRIFLFFPFRCFFLFCLLLCSPVKRHRRRRRCTVMFRQPMRRSAIYDFRHFHIAWRIKEIESFYKDIELGSSFAFKALDAENERGNQKEMNSMTNAERLVKVLFLGLYMNYNLYFISFIVVLIRVYGMPTGFETCFLIKHGRLESLLASSLT